MCQQRAENKTGENQETNYKLKPVKCKPRDQVSIKNNALNRDPKAGDIWKTGIWDRETQKHKGRINRNGKRNGERLETNRRDRDTSGD